ncbi:MAG TPA: BON domain-containing protein [Blastocatellia bacterium]|nr:BON domain-containing protein [Blastocatellia bacterium]
MKALVIPFLIAVGLLLVSCSSQAVDDSKVTAKIESKLVADAETSALKIRVETRDGVVTLSGAVPTDTEKNKAEQLAKSTEGVKRVVNDVKVDPNSLGASNVREKAGEAAKKVGESISDAAILATLKTKLLADGITGTNVDVENGDVVLKGQVDDSKEKAKAEEIARKTAGVKEVRNELTVKKYKAT